LSSSEEENRLEYEGIEDLIGLPDLGLGSRGGHGLRRTKGVQWLREATSDLTQHAERGGEGGRTLLTILCKRGTTKDAYSSRGVYRLTVN